MPILLSDETTPAPSPFLVDANTTALARQPTTPPPLISPEPTETVTPTPSLTPVSKPGEFIGVTATLSPLATSGPGNLPNSEVPGAATATRDRFIAEMPDEHRANQLGPETSTPKPNSNLPEATSGVVAEVPGDANVESSATTDNRPVEDEQQNAFPSETTPDEFKPEIAPLDPISEHMRGEASTPSALEQDRTLTNDSANIVTGDSQTAIDEPALENRQQDGLPGQVSSPTIGNRPEALPITGLEQGRAPGVIIWLAASLLLLLLFFGSTALGQKETGGK